MDCASAFGSTRCAAEAAVGGIVKSPPAGAMLYGRRRVPLDRRRVLERPLAICGLGAARCTCSRSRPPVPRQAGHESWPQAARC